MKFSKSFILFLLSFFSVLSCSKHVQDTDFQSGNTIRISMPESFGTKVSMGEQTGNSISQVWNSGDRIAVVQGRGTESMKLSVYALIGEGGTSSGEFEFVSGNADVSGEVDVVYPVEAAYGSSIPHMQEYMEGNYDAHDTTMFNIVYEFATYAEYNPLPRCFKHKKTDPNNAELKQYLVERAPHCLFTDKVKTLADSIVGKEKRPYYQARKLFAAIRELYPWAGACEYGIIDNIPEYVIENRHGDCGQVTLLYIAMCRYLGIPARWQSGFMLHPGYDNLHDWCEIYIEGMGWIPVDPSFGVQSWGKTEAERYFYFGGIDAYRLIVNTDWGTELTPKKQYERSEPVDFQRGECETENKNLYFDQWKYKFIVKLKN